MKRNKNITDPELRSLKALEMTMCDVLEGLQDASCQLSFQPRMDDLEVLSIEAPPELPHQPGKQVASVHSIPMQRSSDVLQFLLTRETRLAS